MNLVTDICQRNGIKKLIWFANRERTLAYQRQDGEACLTVHRWFANKSCPGDYLYSLHGQIADEVTRRLGGGAVAPDSSTQRYIEYTVKKGDILSKIAQKYGVTTAAIMGLNPSIKDPNKIYVGQVIKIPVAAKADSAPAFTAYDGVVNAKPCLNVRATPGTTKDCKIIGCLVNGKRVTIVAEKTVHLVKWGQLSSGGWVCLKYVKKI